MSDKQSGRPGGISADGSYRYVRPESRETLYRDARVESTEDAAQMPRYYVPPQKAPKEPKKAPKTEGTFLRAACMCLACALLGGVLGSGITAAMIYRHTEIARADMPQSDAPVEETAPTRMETTAPPVESGEKSIAATVSVTDDGVSPSDIYQMACQQVVGIQTGMTSENFFGHPSSTAVSGSGFILSEDGYIITNYHVIEYAEQYGCDITVMDYDGETYLASVVGIQPENDLAVLRIPASDLSPVTLGDSDAIQVGDPAYPVGNPLGEMDCTMTFGRVTALKSSITIGDDAPIDLFQIDAAVNCGSSGGPVYDATGTVVGVVTARYPSSEMEGLGFAIPINDAVDIAEELITSGGVKEKVYLGARVRTMSLNAALFYNSVEGVYVVSVDEGSPAEEAGLRPGDVICRMEADSIGAEEDYRAALRTCQIGDTIELGVFRRGEVMSVEVTLGEDQEGEAAIEQTPSSTLCPDDAAGPAA